MTDTDESRPSSWPNGRRTTLKDVARRAGVDPSLVSRIVNNDPKAAATPETWQRVLDAVDTLGYRPSVTARGLRTARTMTIGLLLPDLTNPMYVSIVRGVEGAAVELGYETVIASRVDSEPEYELTRLLTDGRVDGLLVASGTLDDAPLVEMSARGRGPVVLVNRNVKGVPASVTVDDAAGVALAVSHLASLGHRSITALFGPSNIDTTIRRQRGFKESCKKYGIRGTGIEGGSWTPEVGYELAAKLFSGKQRCTALFASTFAMAVGALRAAREAGVDVPHDVSVITLHDSPLAEYLSPPLTVIALPSEEMGSEAVNLLHQMTTGGEPSRIVVSTPPKLILRESTGPCIS
jgi:LacI family transcriptional regulator